MKVAYITAHAPYGKGEAFVIEEMLAMADIGAKLVIVPRNPPKEVFHGNSRLLLSCAVWMPLLSWRFIFSLFRAIMSEPRMWKVLGNIIGQSRSLKIMVKNLTVAPKAVFIAGILRHAGIEHIHAHWGSTTATMAWIASELTGIPWSVTLHRWDIAENNLLKLKVERASFVRCISEAGRCELLQLVGEIYRDKVKVLHMGVRLPNRLPPEARPQRSDFVIACPANLVPVKGHSFLLQACALLMKGRIRNVKCLIIGDGPLEPEIRWQIKLLELEEVVELRGCLPHEELMHMYVRGEVDAVVLPSITTDDGQREGIPVALMEAMAHGIPVVSTETGGIPELLSEGAGIIVKERDPRQLAGAIEKLIRDRKIAAEIIPKGMQRVAEEFDIHKNAIILFQYMKSNSKKVIS